LEKNSKKERITFQKSGKEKEKKKKRGALLRSPRSLLDWTRKEKVRGRL